MDQLSQVRDRLTNLGSQLDQGVQLTGGIVSAVILQLITVIDMFGMAETERGSFAHQTGVEIRTLHEKMSQAQGGIDVTCSPIRRAVRVESSPSWRAKQSRG